MMHSHSDETTGSRLPWLDKPVLLHSSRADTCKLTPEQCDYRSGYWRYWYEADHVYSLSTVYFLIAIVGFFTILHFLSLYAPSSVKRSGLWRKGVAVSRYLAYKGYQVPSLRWYSYPLGVMLLGGLGTVFFFAMTLGPKPYYWPNTETLSYGNSPPIATRTGWMALALLPFVLVLGTKANMISALTGVPHEKLQVFHHWTSYAMFVLALIHTFPFIVFHIWKGDMVKQWKTSVVYWTGVVALIAQTYLTVMSLPFIRNRYYEFFKATHFIVALLFLLFFFFHCDFRLSSWDYFIATATLYALSLTTSLIRTTLHHGLHTATLTPLTTTNNTTTLHLTIPTITTPWTPSQHLFLRFLSPKLGLHALTAHPFTISSLPHDPAITSKAPVLSFHIKPRAGITARLAALAARDPGASYRVLLEGPYGGVGRGVEIRAFETLVVVVGGSGGGFGLGVLGEGMRGFASYHSSDSSTGIYGEKDKMKKRIHVVFATRDAAVAGWFADEVESMISVYGISGENVCVSIHLTSCPSSSPAPGDVDGNGKDKEKEVGSAETAIHAGVTVGKRPDLPAIVAAETAEKDRRVGVFVCGPASMLHDVRNAAAEAQGRVVRGLGADEVYLHTESFSW